MLDTQGIITRMHTHTKNHNQYKLSRNYAKLLKFIVNKTSFKTLLIVLDSIFVVIKHKSCEITIQSQLQGS